MAGAVLLLPPPLPCPLASHIHSTSSCLQWWCWMLIIGVHGHPLHCLPGSGGGGGVMAPLVIIWPWCIHLPHDEQWLMRLEVGGALCHCPLLVSPLPLLSSLSHSPPHCHHLILPLSVIVPSLSSFHPPFLPRPVIANSCGPGAPTFHLTSGGSSVWMWVLHCLLLSLLFSLCALCALIVCVVCVVCVVPPPLHSVVLSPSCCSWFPSLYYLCLVCTSPTFYEQLLVAEGSGAMAWSSWCWILVPGCTCRLPHT
jgi:hypothetical protein